MCTCTGARKGPQVKIPFNKPSIIGNELRYIHEAVERGQLAGDGHFARRCEEWLQDRFAAKRVMLTHSCTAALEMAAMLCDAGPDTEVAMPSYTFTSTANAFALRGAPIRFVDIVESTLNMDTDRLAAAISNRTRIVVPVHYAGVACEMDPILTLAEERGLRVVEDAAQGVCASYRGRWLGTLGHLGAYSFHETKNFISGEGGALVINDPALVERAEIIRQKGTNRARFNRGEVDKYTWVDIGSSYPPSELVSAFLFAQLESSGQITERRLSIYERYRLAFAGLAAQGRVRLPVVPSHCGHNAHMFYLITDTPEIRDRLIRHLREADIHAIFHYVPLHLSPMGRRMGYAPGDLPITESLADRIVRLPLFHALDTEGQDRVIESVLRFFRG